MSLTIHLLTRNNAKYLKRCLESLSPLGAEILVYDQGSTDETPVIAKEYATLVTVPWRMNRSQLRNQIISGIGSDWQMYMHPWETLTDVDAIQLAMTSEESYYHLLVLQGEVITKEVRLWRSSLNPKFDNYAFEFIHQEVPKILNCMIYSSGTQDDYEPHIRTWRREQPLLSDPMYYSACLALSRGKWNDFLLMANHFVLAENKATMPVILTKYYLAMVYSNIRKQYASAIKELVEILAVKPLMAEFWCLLGDIHYKIKEFHKAKAFYETAVQLGKHRRLDDLDPIETRKYAEYPTEMIESCEKLEKELVFAAKPTTLR